MAVVYNTATLTDRLTVVINHIDAGPANGILNIGTAGMGTILSSITLSKPCGVAAAGVLTFTVPAAGAVLHAGLAAAANITDSTGAIVISGLTVGLSTASDIVMTTTTLPLGQFVSLQAATITGT